MYFQQAMQQKDKGKCVDSVAKEENGHVDHQSWELKNVEDVPENAEIIHSVWAKRGEERFGHY